MELSCFLFGCLIGGVAMLIVTEFLASAGHIFYWGDGFRDNLGDWHGTDLTCFGYKITCEKVK